MTPLQYMERYWKLDVPVDKDDGSTDWVRVKVSRYRLGESGKNPKEKLLSKLRPVLNKGEPVAVKVKTILGDTEEFTFKSRAAIAPFVAAPFVGKGSPEDVQIVLQLLVRYGVVKGTQPDLQAYCDEIEDHRQMGNIGLDCNGFVGNFLRHTVGGMRWDEKAGKGDEAAWASAWIGSMLKQVGTRIKRSEDLVSNAIYGLGYVNAAGNVIERIEGGKVGHIMITQPLTLHPQNGTNGLGPADNLVFNVVEATGRGKGLLLSEYKLLGVDKRGVFTVWRGSQQEKMNVQIYRIYGF